MRELKFLPVAQAVASLSKDPSTKVGAILLDDDSNIRCVGFNGFARGVHDYPERLNNRETKLLYTSHAEQNLIAQAARMGVTTNGCTILVTALYPCTRCASSIIQAGIKKVIAPHMDTERVNKQWFEEQLIAEKMFNEGGVEVVRYGQQT